MQADRGRRAVTRSGRRAALAWLASAVALAASRPAAAAGISPAERARLASGELIRRHIDVELAAGSYFGGVAYAVIRAPAEAVIAALYDASAYPHIFPLLMEGRLVGMRGADRLVYFRHGGRVASAGYTAIVRRESPGLVRFWLDPSEPHDIEDCWGYFRVQPFGEGAVLLTYAALLRLEFGVVKLLFSEKIRAYALETPALVRRWVEGRAR